MVAARERSDRDWLAATSTRQMQHTLVPPDAQLAAGSGRRKGSRRTGGTGTCLARGDSDAQDAARLCYLTNMLPLVVGEGVA